MGVSQDEINKNNNNTFEEEVLADIKMTTTDVAPTEEPERPPMDLFRAIFADDDDDSVASSSDEEKDDEATETTTITNFTKVSSDLSANLVEKTNELFVDEQPSSAMSHHKLQQQSFVEQKFTTFSQISSFTVANVLTYGPTLPPEINNGNNLVLLVTEMMKV